MWICLLFAYYFFQPGNLPIAKHKAKNVTQRESQSQSHDLLNFIII